MEADEDKPKAPVSPYSKNEAPVHLVMCVDTMGQVRSHSVDGLHRRGRSRATNSSAL